MKIDVRLVHNTNSTDSLIILKNYNFQLESYFLLSLQRTNSLKEH